MSTGHTATCEDCGYTTTSRTEKLAAKGLRMHSCDKARRKAAAKARGEARRAAVDRTPKPCHHKQTEHVHGTHACYVLDECRCYDCSRANADYERARAKRHAYGRFGNDWVDAGPVRDHVKALQAQGLGLKGIVRLSGYSQGGMTKLMYGLNGHAPTRRIRRESAEKILAVRATLDTLAGGVVIDGTGTHRRLQALMTLGWSQSKLAAEIGYSVRNFNHLVQGKRDVTVTNARAVADLYERLWNTEPPRATIGDRGAHTRSKRYAADHGWVGPMWWDTDTIDDPTARPNLDNTTPQNTGRGRLAEHVAEDTEWILDDDPTLTARHIAHRLDVTVNTLRITLKRAGRPDLLDRLARNDALTRGVNRPERKTA